MTRTLPITEVKSHLTQLVKGVEERAEEIVVTKKGKPAAMLVNYEDYEGLMATLDLLSDKKAMAQIKRGSEYFKKGGKGLTIEEMFGE